MVFNKAADSCDYPRNVICPKNKKPSSTTTTKAPSTTSTTVRTTKKTTTEKEPEEEEEEYDYEDESDEEDVSDEPEEPKAVVTPKTLLYKTISRSKPKTTTTTETPSTTAAGRSFKVTSEKIFSSEDEEDPRVIKELIELIKKAGYCCFHKNNYDALND